MDIFGGRKFTIEVKDIYYSYPGADYPAIRDLSTNVKQGEFITVMGPDGSGKSTLARLISGILSPVKGQVLVDGLNIYNVENQEEIRLRVGLVLSNPDNQLVAARVEEDVAFGPENLNLPPKEIRRRVDEAINMVGINHLRERPPHLLSGSEKQLLAIAGLIALRPLCLVLDGSTSMLDPTGRYKVLRLLRSLVAGNMSVILITNNIEEAAISDRLWVLKSGDLMFDDSPVRVLERPGLLRDLGLGLTGTAGLAMALADQSVDLPSGIVTIDEMVEFLCCALK